MKRCAGITSVLVFVIGIISLGDTLFAESIPRGMELSYFKKFFTKHQPSSYYDFSGIERKVFYPDSSIAHLSYRVVEDFSQANSWGIISPSAQFSRPASNTAPIQDSELLNWKTFQKSDVDYTLLPSVNRSQTLRPSPPSIMGVRSLFLQNGSKVIKIYPKNNIFFPSFDIHSVEFWVFSINLPYDVYMIFQDYKGMLHKVYAGNLKYFGWARLRIPFDMRQLGGEKPSLMYTRAIETRLKLNAISFESQNNTDTAGFFGVWLGDLGISFSPKLKIPDSISSPAAKLSTSFDWNEPENQSRPAPADERVTTFAGQ